jgi:CheY-like chemotaxis protein
LTDILIVEDNPGDVRLIERALKDSPAPPRLHVAGDGVVALDFLRHTGPHPNAPRPDLILLDLNLPKKNGQEVLAEIKSDPALNCIPVIVFTTSDAEADIRRAYELHANCYVVKPAEFDKFMAVLRSLEAFWLDAVQLPPP